MGANTYNSDFVVWTEQQAVALRQAARDGANLPLDWDNLAEEIESVGRSERSEVKSLIANILAHLLKRALSPAVHPRERWESEIDYSRTLLRKRLTDSPSLRPALPEFVEGEIRHARRLAARSLRTYGEDDAAEAAERVDLDLSADDVLDDGFYLPGTVFRREPD